MIVELAGLADLPAMSELEIWFPERERWSAASWEAEISAQDRFVLVARGSVAEAVVGAATFQLVGDTVDLHRIVVAGPHRRRGLAQVMLMTGLHWALQAGAARILLEVDSKNAGAIALYRRYGFRQIAERRDYYAPGAHALVLELDLAGLEIDEIGPWGTLGAA